MICDNENCERCFIERHGCGCDGAYDDGCWFCNDKHKDEKPDCILASDLERYADELIRLGYHQVSHKYRAVARVPPGKTALDALFEAEPMWRDHFERQARGVYLRGIVPEEFTTELTREQFAAFKKRNGPIA